MGAAGAAGVGGTGRVDGTTFGAGTGFGAGTSCGFASTGDVGAAAFLAGAAVVPVPTGWATGFGAPTADTIRTGVADGGVVCAVATAVKK